MKELELPQNTVLLGEREYATAIDVVITEAQEQLLFFDQDCSVGDFASIKRFDLLTAFLNKSGLTKLTIILHHTDFLPPRARDYFNYCQRSLIRWLFIKPTIMQK